MIKDGHKLIIPKRDSISVEKLFTHDFFAYLGLKNVHVRSVSQSSKESQIDVDTSVPIPHSVDPSDMGSELEEDITATNNVLTLPDPSIKHVDNPITEKDFEIPPAIDNNTRSVDGLIKGGGVLSSISNFFSSFLMKKSGSIETSMFKSTAEDSDIEIVFDKAGLDGSVILLKDLKSTPMNSTKTIYAMDIFGGMEYVEYAALSNCLDRQMEYMEMMGIQLKTWRVDLIYKIGDHYINFDIENMDAAEKGYNKGMREGKRDFLKGEIGVEAIKIKGTREGR